MVKEPSERGQGTKPPQKKKRQLRTLIVWAGIANSTREAGEMLAGGEICHGDTDDAATWAHGDGKRKPDDPSTLGTLMLDIDTRIVHRSKCPECSKPIVFARRDRKPARSSTTHSRVLVGDDSDDDERNLPGEVQRKEDLFSLYSSDPRFIPQDLLREWFHMRQEFAEFGEAIAIALSRGAKIAKGIHTAELVPIRNEDGSVHLKLVVR